ncbi:hypothetical protein AB0L41_45400 [Amycolatopsis mediterranei]|uniref:hypothetical protein n=1 Tax=Amycolatopsis mediterranei TaxID=33910 RepID=UPI00343EA4C7
MLIGLGEAQRGVDDHAYRKTPRIAGHRGSAAGSGRTEAERVALLESGRRRDRRRPAPAAPAAVRDLGRGAARRELGEDLANGGIVGQVANLR